MNKLNLQGFTNLQDCLEKALPPVEGEIRKYKDGKYKFIDGHWKKLKQEDIKKIQNEIKTNWELRTKEQEQDKIILIPDSKDYERAKSAKLQSEKAIASQAKSIQDLEKVLKRGLAFEFFKNKYSKEFRNRARELGATPKLLQRYDKLVEVMGEHANYEFEKVYKESDYTVSGGYGGKTIRKPFKDAANPDDEDYKKYIDGKIERWNKNRQSDLSFVFPNHFSADLWMDEYSGQISDGKYENTRMYDINRGAYNFKVEINSNIEKGCVKLDDKLVPGMWRGAKPSFADLLWLFDEGEVFGSGEKKYNVRAVGSKLPNNILRKYITQTEGIFGK